jgi:hypothetical protein
MSKTTATRIFLSGFAFPSDSSVKVAVVFPELWAQKIVLPGWSMRQKVLRNSEINYFSVLAQPPLAICF